MSHGGLVSNARMLRDFAAAEGKLVDSIDRMLAKQRGAPEVRMRQYIEAQASPVVRDALRRLVGARKWRYVSFSEFLDATRATTARLMVALAATKGPVCFVIDDVSKSSHWVLALCMHMARDAMRALAKQHRLHMVVDDGGAIRPAFERLPDNTTLVLMDDATYSGEQISYFMSVTLRAWRASHRGKDPAGLFVHVPYVCRPSMRFFKAATAVFNHETFDNLFQRRRVVDVLCADLFLERRNPMFTEYQSLFFDVLALQPTNALIMFEHKIADGLSIPNRWLHAGPCVSPDFTAAYVVRPGAAAELAAFLATTPVHVFDNPKRKAANPRDASRRVIEMMQSPAFRRRFMDRARIDPPPPTAPLFFPLLPPEFCEARYQRFMRRHLHGSASARGHNHHLFNPPDCRKPPYKRSSYKARVAGLPP